MPTRSAAHPSAIAGRRIAPFAPLAIAALAAHSPALRTGEPAPVAVNETNGETVELTPQRCDNVTDIADCHARYLTGCSLVGGRYDPYLNLMKNKLLTPPATDTNVRMLTLGDFQQLDASTPTDLGSNQIDEEDQLSALGEGSTVGVIGYLYYAKVSGPETSNCQIGKNGGAKDEGNFDYHIGIGFDAETARGVRSGSADQKSLGQESIIVEMTPHYRARFENGNWTSANLKAVIGRRVKVIGQLLADTEHNKPGQNCAVAESAKDKSTCWRASIWELHPVTEFLVCKDASSSCGNDPADWLQLPQAAGGS